ncbi:MAG TPA: hypothetical protein VHG71_06570 [Verrucomicrobiae bacterium]|nr:hypothetical protein [Verrucomicrobiae bacterium]
MKILKKVGVGFLVLAPVVLFAASGDPDATTIATNANTAFATIAPITISIVGFYVILRLAKRTVK